jgi:hypothetical protein
MCEKSWGIYFPLSASHDKMFSSENISTEKNEAPIS